MTKVNKDITLDDSEISFSYICSPGPGGQNVNKLATAVLLRFNIEKSTSLPQAVKERLHGIAKNKISSQNELIIKASCHRTQARNKQDAIDRLKHYIQLAAIKPTYRKKTKPTYGSTQKRLKNKKNRGQLKSLRQNKSES